ncbi:hypothetical protein DW757_14385 [Clostridium sp. AM29-11AC]|nr:hypothetical protein DW757_14385 [Clostridium sp. AM29-11AC]
MSLASFICFFFSFWFLLFPLASFYFPLFYFIFFFFLLFEDIHLLFSHRANSSFIVSNSS